jgi:hypothetical protein
LQKFPKQSLRVATFSRSVVFPGTVNLLISGRVPLSRVSGGASDRRLWVAGFDHGGNVHLFRLLTNRGLHHAYRQGAWPRSCCRPAAVGLCGRRAAAGRTGRATGSWLSRRPR